MAGAIVTNLGRKIIADAVAGNGSVELSYIAIGDSNVVHTENSTKLGHKAWQGEIIESGVDGVVVYAYTMMQNSDGPFTIKEIGLYDTYDNLIAVTNVPATPKESGGAVNSMKLGLRKAVENADAISFTITDKFDSVLNKNSVNAVENKALTKEFNAINNSIENINENFNAINEDIKILNTDISDIGDDISYLHRQKINYSVVDNASISIDNLTSTGIYSIASCKEANAGNTPFSSGTGTLIVTSNGDWVGQTCILYEEDTIPIRSRVKINGVWSGWSIG